MHCTCAHWPILLTLAATALGCGRSSASERTEHEGVPPRDASSSAGTDAGTTPDGNSSTTSDAGTITGDASITPMGPPCDAATFEPRCATNDVVYCSAGHETRAPCAAPNPLCIDQPGTEPGCYAAPPGDTCGGPSLPPCVDGLVLTCWQSSAGSIVQSYAPCAPMTRCAPSSTVENAGECTPDGPSCSPDRSYCEGDMQVVCEQGVETRLDCSFGEAGSTCLASLAGDHAICGVPGETTCDPATFPRRCLPEGEAELCDDFGYVRRVTCPGGSTCCADDPTEDQACCGLDPFSG